MSGKPNMRAVFDARNRVICRLYLEEKWLLSEIADALGMSQSNVWRILSNAGAKLPNGQRQARIIAANRKKAKDAHYRRVLSEATRLAWANGTMRGRPTLFDDDPEKRVHYLILRKKVGAVEAKQLLEAA